MRAYIGTCGLNISLINKDKDKDKKRLEFVIDDFKKPKVILFVKKNVDNKRLWEEHGFHIQAWPPNVSLYRATKIYVYLSEERWHDLINKRDEEVKDCGFFGSRCKYDRCMINYYPDI